MKHMTTHGGRERGARLSVILLACAAALLLMLGTSRARAAEASLGDESQACQDCHAKPDLAMQTQDGRAWPLHVSTDAYLKSRHAANDCVDCHEDIEGAAHAKDKPAVKSRRAYALALNDGCKSCHKKHVAQYQDSVHAALVKAGSDKAPMCSDCHDVHTQRSVKLPAPVDQTPCLKCHDAIGKAWAADVHGLERVARGKPAPICADCHQAHAIHAASSGDGLRDACFGCHENAVAQHRGWLPNTGRHFESISCPVCHAPTAERRVNLRLYDGQGLRPLVERAGVPRFEKLVSVVDTQNRGLDERALWSLLQAFDDDAASSDVVLRGRLEVRSGVQAHQLAAKEKAIRDCDTCHRQGAAAFQSVVLSIAGPDGRALRHDVDHRVLSSLTAIESVRGFYAIGANRIRLLDVLLVLVVAGSVGGVLAHMTIKWATRRIRAKVAAEPRTPPQ